MAETQIEVWRTDDTYLIRVTGVVDFAAAARLRMALVEQVDAGATELVVDLTKVRLLDAGATGVLVRASDQMADAGGVLRVIGAAGMVRKVLEITGVAKQLRAHEEFELSAVQTERLRKIDVDPGRWHGLWGDEVNRLLAAMMDLPADDPARVRLRNQVIEACLPQAERLARRFHGLGESPEDLSQVAVLGLLKAVDRFDTGLSTDFAAYATPTIVGELKRHFRDRGWSVRVPRRLQELRLEINKAREALTQRLGRSPTAADVAEHLGVGEEQVIEALVASGAYRATSIYAPVSGDGEDAVTTADRLGADDASYAAVEYREALRPLIAAMPARERKILSMRFYGNCTQTQIAEQLGISQMHVSRLIARSVATLRRALLAEG